VHWFSFRGPRFERFVAVERCRNTTCDGGRGYLPRPPSRPAFSNFIDSDGYGPTGTRRRAATEKERKFLLRRAANVDSARAAVRHGLMGRCAFPDANRLALPGSGGVTRTGALGDFGVPKRPMFEQFRCRGCSGPCGARLLPRNAVRDVRAPEKRSDLTPGGVWREPARFRGAGRFPMARTVFIFGGPRVRASGRGFGGS